MLDRRTRDVLLIFVLAHLRRVVIDELGERLRVARAEERVDRSRWHPVVEAFEPRIERQPQS